MDIWIIRDGEKVGPLQDYQVRREIETGELLPTTPAWHDGLTEWKTLGELAVFTREFEPRPAAEISQLTPPPLPQPTHYLRRFWARWFDLFLYSGLWWLGMWAAGQNIETLLFNPWISLFHYVPWFVIEAILLHYLATTPGKWLLGIRVTNLDGTRLELAAATRRSLRVLLSGIAFGWGPLSLICQAISLYNAKRLGTAHWDHIGGHRLHVRRLHPLGIITLVLMFYAAIQLQVAVTFPYTLDVVLKTYPELKPHFDKNAIWAFPKRH